MYTAWNSSDREYRKEFTDKFYNTYLDYKTTLSDLVISNIKEITMLAKIKKYSSVLQMKYLNRDVDEKVYDNLLSTTKGNLSTFHRYRNIKKEYMGLDSIHYYDVFTSIQSDNSTYTFEEGKTYILS
ncbi:MAG: M3 family metallopeptidase [Patescibacteria group bacterium]